MNLMATDDLSYGDGHFDFKFKDGTTLKLASDGSFERAGQKQECTAVATAQSQPPVYVRPDLADSEEAHILTICLAIPPAIHVAMRGLLAIRRERNRSLEARESTRAAFATEETKRLS